MENSTTDDAGIPVPSDEHSLTVGPDGPHADPAAVGPGAGWHSDGGLVHEAYMLRRDDDDWGQARTMVRDASSYRTAIEFDWRRGDLD